MFISIRKTIAGNVERLMDHLGKTGPRGKKMTQGELAKKTGLAQRTICNIFIEDGNESIKSETIEKLAEYFGLMPYHLLIPDLPIEELLTNRLEKVIQCYSNVPKEGRENIMRISENELRYCAAQETKNIKK
jgi:transcriptional regulator with XRE-family HTH domain